MWLCIVHKRADQARPSCLIQCHKKTRPCCYRVLCTWPNDGVTTYRVWHAIKTLRLTRSRTGGEQWAKSSARRPQGGEVLEEVSHPHWGWDLEVEILSYFKLTKYTLNWKVNISKSTDGYFRINVAKLHARPTVTPLPSKFNICVHLRNAPGRKWSGHVHPSPHNGDAP